MPYATCTEPETTTSAVDDDRRGERRCDDEPPHVVEHVQPQSPSVEAARRIERQNGSGERAHPQRRRRRRARQPPAERRRAAREHEHGEIDAENGDRPAGAGSQVPGDLRLGDDDVVRPFGARRLDC
jgi:hypothetical protein